MSKKVLPTISWVVGWFNCFLPNGGELVIMYIQSGCLGSHRNNYKRETEDLYAIL